MIIKDTVVLVTGAAKKGRIGHALAVQAARQGAHVIVHYIPEKEDPTEVAEEVRSYGVQAVTYGADLRDHSALAGLVHAADDIAPVSALINSASGFVEDTLLDITPESLDTTFAVTLRAPIFLTQAFAAALPKGSEGVVINITDRRTERPYKNHFGYLIAKGALNQFTITAAVELGPQIRVNAVALGAILPPPGKTEDYLQDLVASQPLPRAGGVVTVAQAVQYIIDNDFVTGETLRVDGGAHLV